MESVEVPRVWALLGYKAGDNTQVRSLAAALGWPWRGVQLHYRTTEILSNLLLGPNLAGIDPRASDALQPPWPDLVISSGRRNEPVARWIRRASGGRARLVHLGRPWARPAHFDLVITTPQYRVPPVPGVLELALPLHGLTPARLGAAGDRWRDALQQLPAPRIALLVGGDSGSFLMPVDRVRQIRLAAEAMATERDGSLLVTDSARTPAAARAALFDALELPHHAWRWGSGGENPYLGYLAWADCFIVTGDSASMVAEACSTGKPVYLVHPQRHPLPLPGTGGRPDWLRPGWYRWRAISHRVAQRLGPRRLRRDVPALLQGLVASGRAAWLGGPAPVASAAGNPDLERALARVRALFAG